MIKVQHINVEARTEAEAIEILHDLAMKAKSPVEACIFRGLKQLMPGMQRWIEEERNRNPVSITVLQASPSVFLALMMGVVKDASMGNVRLASAIYGTLVKAIEDALKVGGEALRHMESEQRTAREASR